MERHVDVIGALWIAMGAIGVIFGLGTFGVLFGVSFIPDMGHEAPIILRVVGLSVGLFIVVLSAPEIIAGIGLLKRLEWARILALVVAFFNLLNIPLGTALGVYSLVILLKEETALLFRRQPKKA
ncbi:MAG: hypothetical protein ACE5L7_04025 [Candidatus Aminicenantales bacterium]